MKMTTSDNGLHFIERWEGCVLEIYQDVVGYDTIGIGHLIVDDDPDFSSGLTRGQAIDLLREDVKHAERMIYWHTMVDLNQEQFDALASWVFNLGGTNFQRSTLLKCLNLGEYEMVPAQIKRWNRAGGTVVPGLVNRREAEAKLWATGDYGL